jgi:signal transduction histidine kinase
VRLIDFIRTQPDAIEREWEQFAKTLTPFAAGLNVSTLRDHLREILTAIVDDMEAPQTNAEQAQKSKGEGPRGNALDRITATHASMRLDSGFELEHAIAEYRALRASILRLWSQSRPSPEERDVDEVTRFNETIDQSIAEIIRRFADNTSRYSNRLMGILVHDVRTPLNSINMAAYQLQQGSFSEM